MQGTPRRIAISFGDPAGIGPEIALKAAIDPRVTRACRPLLVGDGNALARHAGACGLDAPIHSHRSAAEIDWRSGGVEALALDDIGDDAAARAAIRAALEGYVDAVIAAPRGASPAAAAELDDDAGFVASCTGIPVEASYLMWCIGETRIVRLTPRWPLVRAVALVTRERVLRAIAETHAALHRTGVAAPRIAIAGLNPHAGEGGLFGDEEILTIGPAIAAAQAAGIRAEGPFGADTMLHKAGIDAFIVMVHDQGDVAAGILAPRGAPRLTIGAPVLYCSVAQESALASAGRDRATPDAIVAAVQLLVGPARQKAA